MTRQECGSDRYNGRIASRGETADSCGCRGVFWERAPVEAPPHRSNDPVSSDPHMRRALARSSAARQA